MGDIDWAGRMARLPDEDLIEIVSTENSGGFEPHVVEAARVELERRDLPEAVAQSLGEAAQGRQEERDARAAEPLSNAGWVAFVLCGPILLATIAVVIIFASMGQTRKAKDALGAIFLSFVFWALVMAVLAFLLG
ncbi:hypothetical protein L7H23_03935 [Sphingopyxis sp. BSN-002]|uniref:hypothetical protein n=1 Tax=Sphingopyxis sp. BSN-002 TaxID=2911495 RepID=UPI001EDC3B12|nr:hypothetical protein [Sphingopyxis sp. BSN-002]UKK85274.1 hypothetical protein L7H23_03935 [Sphingopyxis sp. BSN-002]